MDNDFENVKKDKKEKKNKKKTPLTNNNVEEVFFLSNLLCDGACIRCMNRSCKINEPHGITFPEKMGIFVQNPPYISGMDKVFNDAVIDFNGKKPFYTICNYINGNCRNCKEGRIKHIKYNDENIAVCYPTLDNNRNKITVGVHADIKLVMKGNKFESSIIPVEIIFEEDNFENISPNSEDLIDEWPVLNNYKKDYVQNEITKSNSFLDALKLNSDKNIINEYEEMHKNYEKENINYEKQNKNYENNDFEYEYYENNDFENKNFKNKNCEDKYYENNGFNQYHYSLVERNHFLEEEILRFTDIINSLKERNISLEKKVESLQKKIDYDKMVFKHAEKYDEILYNLHHLNNTISDQFFESNYSEYIIL